MREARLRWSGASRVEDPPSRAKAAAGRSVLSNSGGDASRRFARPRAARRRDHAMSVAQDNGAGFGCATRPKRPSARAAPHGRVGEDERRVGDLAALPACLGRDEPAPELPRKWRRCRPAIRGSSLSRAPSAGLPCALAAAGACAVLLLAVATLRAAAAPPTPPRRRDHPVDAPERSVDPRLAAPARGGLLRRPGEVDDPPSAAGRRDRSERLAAQNRRRQLGQAARGARARALHRDSRGSRSREPQRARCCVGHGADWRSARRASAAAACTDRARAHRGRGRPALDAQRPAARAGASGGCRAARGRSKQHAAAAPRRPRVDRCVSPPDRGCALAHARRRNGSRGFSCGSSTPGSRTKRHWGSVAVPRAAPRRRRTRGSSPCPPPRRTAYSLHSTRAGLRAARLAVLARARSRTSSGRRRRTNM